MGKISSTSSLQPHALQLAIESLPFNTKYLSGAALVTPSRSQHLANLLGLSVGQRLTGRVARIHGLYRRTNSLSVNPRIRRKNRKALDQVLYLPDIARPSVLFKRSESRFGEPGI